MNMQQIDVQKTKVVLGWKEWVATISFVAAMVSGFWYREYHNTAQFAKHDEQIEALTAQNKTQLEFNKEQLALIKSQADRLDKNERVLIAKGIILP